KRGGGRVGAPGWGFSKITLIVGKVWRPHPTAASRRPPSPRVPRGRDGRERAITARALSKRPIASVHRAAAGFFQEFVDQGLADPRGHLLVDRHHGLAHRRILLLCQVKELGLAGLLDVRERVAVFPARLAVA